MKARFNEQAHYWKTVGIHKHMEEQKRLEEKKAKDKEDEEKRKLEEKELGINTASKTSLVTVANTSRDTAKSNANTTNHSSIHCNAITASNTNNVPPNGRQIGKGRNSSGGAAASSSKCTIKVPLAVPENGKSNIASLKRKSTSPVEGKLASCF